MRKKADSDLNVECLISTGVETVRVKGRAGNMCAVYSVVMGIGKAEDGRSVRPVRVIRIVGRHVLVDLGMMSRASEE